MSLTKDQEALMEAVLDNNQRKVAALLKKGVDPDFEDNDRTPLNEAISNSNLAMVKALVAAGADVNRADSTYFKDLPLDAADRQNNKKIAEFLEQEGARSSDPDRLTTQQQALMEAIRNDDEDGVTELLDKGLDPDFADNDETPLEAAVRRGSETMVRALVDSGADVNRVNFYDEAPLDIAKNLGDDEITQLLEDEGAVSAQKKSKTAHNTGVRGGFKGGRGRSSGFFDDDVLDDDWDDDAGSRNKKQGAKPHIRAKKSAKKSAAPTIAGMGAEAAKPAKPVFREDTLKDIFNAKNWVGKTNEMEQLWEEVPKRLQKHFDFAASLAEARRETLKQNAPKRNLLQQNFPPQMHGPPAPIEGGMPPARQNPVTAANADDATNADANSKPPQPAAPQPSKPPQPKP
jgi:hypothetical protein